MKNKKFAYWLNDKYIEWMKKDRKRGVSKFAIWLGFKQATISGYLNGQHVPNPENIEKLAGKLGYEIYDALDLPRPDKRFSELKAKYFATPEELRPDLIKIIDAWLDNANAQEVRIKLPKRPP